MSYYAKHYSQKRYQEPCRSWCSICGRDSLGLWCDACLQPFIVKGEAFQPTISYSGPVEASAALARAIVTGGARIVIRP